MQTSGWFKIPVVCRSTSWVSNLTNWAKWANWHSIKLKIVIACNCTCNILSCEFITEIMTMLTKQEVLYILQTVQICYSSGLHWEFQQLKLVHYEWLWWSTFEKYLKPCEQNKFRNQRKCSVSPMSLGTLHMYKVTNCFTMLLKMALDIFAFYQHC